MAAVLPTLERAFDVRAERTTRRGLGAWCAFALNVDEIGTIVVGAPAGMDGGGASIWYAHADEDTPAHVVEFVRTMLGEPDNPFIMTDGTAVAALDAGRPEDRKLAAATQYREVSRRRGKASDLVHPFEALRGIAVGHD